MCRLQDDSRAIFHTSRGRFADHHIACLINDGLQSQPFAKVDQELPDLVHLTGWARNLGDVIEVLKHILRLQVPQGVLERHMRGRAWLFRKQAGVSDRADGGSRGLRGVTAFSASSRSQVFLAVAQNSRGSMT